MACIWNDSILEEHGLNQHALEIPLESWHLVCAPLATIFNLLVLFIAFRYIDLRARLNQWFVISMTLGDLLYGMFYMSTKKYVHCFPREFCALYYVIVWFCQVISIVSLLFLNIDKFLSLRRPLWHSINMTEKVVFWELASSWIVTLAFCLLTYFGPFATLLETSVTECKLQMDPKFYSITTIVIYIVPTVVSFGFSIYIFWIAQKQFKWTGTQVVQETRVETDRARKQFKRVLFVFSSTLWTFITFVPYRTALSVYMLRSAQCSESNARISGSETPQEFHQDCDFSDLLNVVYLLWFLLPLSAVGNPIITIITQRSYRNGCIRILKWWRRKLRTGEQPISSRQPSKRCLELNGGNPTEMEELTLVPKPS